MKNKDYDETLLKLLNDNTRELIKKMLKDYLSQHES